MKVKTLEHWKGALSIIVAAVTPFGAYATGDATLRAAIALGVIAGLTATYNWVDDTLREAKERAAKKRLIASIDEMELPPLQLKAGEEAPKDTP